MSVGSEIGSLDHLIRVSAELAQARRTVDRCKAERDKLIIEAWRDRSVTSAMLQDATGLSRDAIARIRRGER